VLEQVRGAGQLTARRERTGERFQINPATCQVQERFFSTLSCRCRAPPHISLLLDRSRLSVVVGCAVVTWTYIARRSDCGCAAWPGRRAASTTHSCRASARLAASRVVPDSFGQFTCKVIFIELLCIFDKR